MKQTNFLKSFFLLFALIVGSNAWATPQTYNFSSLPTTGWTTSGGSQTINSKTWTYTSSTHISNTESKIQVGSSKNPQTSAWTISIPVSSFGSGKAITNVTITAYTTAASATYGISVGGTSYSSGSLTTSSSNYSTGNINVTTGSIVVTMTGSSTSKAMYLSNISVTFDDATTDPVINASNVNIDAEETEGAISFNITNPVAETHLSATITTGGTWLSNATVDEVNGKVTFVTSVNDDTENSREGTIHLVYGDNLATKDITVTQAAMPLKYTVTYNTAQENGTLVIKNGDDVVTSGSSFTEGTVLTIVTTPDPNYVFRNWQYKREGGSWTTLTAATSYTMTANNVEFRANFDPTYPANFSVNGEIASTSRFAAGASVVFPDDPEDIGGKVFMGWSAAPIDGTTDVAPSYVTKATMGTSDVTYYAVFASETVIEEEFEKTYGFETASDDYWTVSGPVRSTENPNTGSYSGKITSNNTYVTFKDKVNVTSFSFAFARATNNNNYNVYIETSTDNSNWTVVDTYTMSSFPSDGTFDTCKKTFDGTTAYYVRFRCSNTTATRYVDDVTIEYDATEVSYSNYCTTIPANVPVKITAAKYATFASGYDLNFSSMEEEGLYAYTATVADNKITFNRVTKAKAGEGLLLYADVNTSTDFNVPVATDSPAAVASNKLVRGEDTEVASTYDEGATYNYVLSNNGGEVNFYRAAGKKVATNKAYLKNIPAGVAGAKFFLPTGDEEGEETDGIRSIENSELRIENSNYYNLSGQRVGKDYKGIVIVNGKKMLNK